MAMTDLGNLSGDFTPAAGMTGSENLSNLYKQAYTDLLRLQVQQMESTLQGTFQSETIEGDVKSFDKLLKHSDSDLVTRGRYKEWGADGAEAPYGSTDSERRLIEPAWFEYAELFDPRDEVGLMKALAPDGQYLQNIAAIFNRKKDSLILDALKGAVLVQTRAANGVTSNTETGYTGTYKVNAADAATDPMFVVDYGAYEGFEIGCKLSSAAKTDTTPLVAHTPGDTSTSDFSIAGAAAITNAAVTATVLGEIQTDAAAVTGMNVEKLVRARQKLDANNALMPGMPYVCVMHPNQFYDLMSDKADTRFTSIDFNEGKPLANGGVFTFMGFEFRLTTLVPEVQIEVPTYGTAGTAFDTVDTFTVGTAANACRYVYFYSPRAGILGTNNNMSVRFDEIPERGYSLQAYHMLGMNAVRMDGDCVVRVACLDSQA